MQVCRRSLCRLRARKFDLPEEERAQLAASLLDSLPGILSDQDDGVAEALRRDAELDAYPERAIAFDQLDISVRDRRK